MDDDVFDRALIGAAFTQAADLGWRLVSVAGAALSADLSLSRARARFPTRSALLLRFGRIADEAALAEISTEGSVRDRLFDLVMRRIDVLQAHRAGVLALLRALPCEPPTAVLLACATRRSLRWLAQAAGVDLSGLRGQLTLRGLVAVWLWTLRAWQRDENADLSATMAALDAALNRAEQAVRWLGGRSGPEGRSESQPASPSEPAPVAEAPSQATPAPVPQPQPPSAPTSQSPPTPAQPLEPLPPPMSQSPSAAAQPLEPPAPDTPLT